jgi:hypothetical protein
MVDDDLNASLHEALAPLLNKQGPINWSPRPIDASAVWNFCESVEDGNPVYWDEAAGEASRFGRMIAPPQALMALSMGAWWLPPFLKERAAAEVKDFGPIPGATSHQIAVDFGFGTATNVTREEEYFEPFGPGDGRLGHADTLVDVSPIKQTRVGKGVFLTTEMDYITEKSGTLVARARNVLLMYDGSTGREG